MHVWECVWERKKESSDGAGDTTILFPPIFSPPPQDQDPRHMSLHAEYFSRWLRWDWNPGWLGGDSLTSFVQCLTTELWGQFWFILRFPISPCSCSYFRVTKGQSFFIQKKERGLREVPLSADQPRPSPLLASSTRGPPAYLMKSAAPLGQLFRQPRTPAHTPSPTQGVLCVLNS